MNREKNLQSVESEREDYTDKSNRKMNIISYIICVVAAIVVWLIIMNVNDSGAVPESSSAFMETEEYTDCDEEA